MLANHFQDTFRHMEWADATVWSSVLESPAASSDLFIAKTLFHIHEVHHSFLNAWQEKPMERFKYESFDGLKAIHHWGLAFYAKLPAFLAGVTDEDMESPSVLPWAKYFARTLGQEPAATSLRDTLHQVASHTMHHRGQVLRRMRELEMDPPTIDYIVWAWQDRPAADHPSTT